MTLLKCPFFFPPWVWTTANPGCKPCRKAVCKCDHKTVGKWQFWLDAFHATSSEPSMLCAASSAVLSRLYTNIWFFIFSVITLLIFRILLARRACTLVISTRPTINLHATGERACVNFGHCLFLQRQEWAPYFCKNSAADCVLVPRPLSFPLNKVFVGPPPPLKIPGSAPATFVSNLNCWNRNIQFTVSGLRSHVTKPCFLF